MSFWEPSETTLERIGQAWSYLHHDSAAEPREAIAFARVSLEHMYYAWVEEIVEGVVDVLFQRWPSLDDSGRLSFDDETGQVSLLDAAAELVFRREPSVGQVYALDDAALSWMAQPAAVLADPIIAVAITDDARAAAKAAFYAAVAPPEDESGDDHDGSGDDDAGGGFGGTPSPRAGPPPTFRSPSVGEPPPLSPEALTYRVSFDLIVDPSEPNVSLRIVDRSGKWIALDPTARAVVVCVPNGAEKGEPSVEFVAADPQWCPTNPTPWLRSELLEW